MSMIDVVVILILAVIIGLAIRYIVKEKKRGVKCIGCPEGCNCSSCHQSGQTACSGGGSHTGEIPTDMKSYK